MKAAATIASMTLVILTAAILLGMTSNPILADAGAKPPCYWMPYAERP